MATCLAVILLISLLAETGRTPFDLAEGETELVAGFHVELSGPGFTLFFMSEYANILMAAQALLHLYLGA